MNNRTVLRPGFAAALTGLTMLTLIGCASAQPGAAQPDQGDATAEPITVNLGVLGVTARSTEEKLAGYGPNALSFYYSEGLLDSALEQDGIVLGEIVSAASGPAAVSALEGGSVDVVYGVADAPALQAAAGGVSLKIIATPAVNNDAWLVTGPDGPTDVAALAGTNVGTSQGSYLDRYVIGLLADQGVEQGDVQMANFPKTSDAVPALASGELSAYPLPPQLAIAVRDQIGGTIINKASETNPELTSSIFSVASDTFLDAHPDFPERWNRAFEKAVDYTKENEAAFIEYYAEALRADAGDVATYLDTDDFPGEPINDEIIAGLGSTLEYLIDNGYVKDGAVDIDALIAPGIQG